LNDNLWVLCETFFFPRNIALRSHKTRRGYRYALDHFARHLGRQAGLADLDDDAVTLWLSAQLDAGQSVYTVRERLGRILTLWRFLAARRLVECWPTIRRPPAPEPVPLALSVEQAAALFESCRWEPGKISGIRSGWWWEAFLAFVLSTSERLSASRSLRWEWLDLAMLHVTIPPAFRKGQRKAGHYELWPEVVPLIERIKMPPRELVFPWDRSEGCYFYRYGRILERAGLPNGPKWKTHSLRCSHASWRQSLGGDSTRALGHSDPATTRRHYIDARYLPKDDVKLPVPWKQEPRS
jgi:integrase